MRFSFLFLLLSSAASARPTCLATFATLPPFSMPAEGERLELISQTYRDLFDQLGESASAETVEAIVNSAKPFEIPPQHGNDLLSLQRRLKEFEVLIAQKGWNDPDTKIHLLSDLRQRALSLRKARTTRQEAIRKGRLEQEVIRLENASRFTPSPDGQYLLTQSADTTQQIYHFDTERTETSESPPGYDSPVFTADGKAVLFHHGPGKIAYVPFREGKLDWASKHEIGTSLAFLQNLNRVVTSPGDRAYGSIRVQNELFLYDLKDKKRVPVLLNGRPLAAPSTNWTVAPGTSDLTIADLDEAGTGARAIRYRVAADGTATVTEWRTFQRFPVKKVQWTAGGYAVGYTKWDRFLAAALPGKGPAMDLLPKLTDTDTGGTSIIDVQPDPSTGDLLVLAKLAAEQFRVVRFDGKTMNRKSLFDLKGEYLSLHVSPDGKRLVFATGENEAKQIFLENYE